MTDYPRTFSGETAPPDVLELVRQLMPRLLAGEHAALATLRAQYARSSVAAVRLTGVGFYADFAVPDDVPRVEPPTFAGGDVPIDLAGLEAGAGCVLFVRDGRLAFLEGYTYGAEAWPEPVVVRVLGAAQPIVPSEPVA